MKEGFGEESERAVQDDRRESSCRPATGSDEPYLPGEPGAEPSHPERGGHDAGTASAHQERECLSSSKPVFPESGAPSGETI